MALFGRRRGGSSRGATKDDLADLRAWTTERQGVEAYVEPATTFMETTVVLVADDGESLRRRVASAKAAADFARKAGIPIYDTNRVGYPQRMRDYAIRQQGRASGSAAATGGPPRGTRASSRSSSGSAAPSAPLPMSTAVREAVATLQVSADVAGDVSHRPDDETLRQWWKQARARSHPDRRGGDRTEWDEVEQAARTLGLTGG